MLRKTMGLATIGALVAALGLGGSAAADDAGAGVIEKTVPSAGMRVYIDPETGELGAAPSGADSGTQLFQRGLPVDDLVEEVNPAGGYSVNLQRRFGGVARARAVGGGLEVECDAGDKPGEK